MDAGAVSQRPVPPGPGGAAPQLAITATQDLRDIAVPCPCLGRRPGSDQRAPQAGRLRGMGGMAGPPRAGRSGDMTAPADAAGRVPNADRGPGEWYDVRPHRTRPAPAVSAATAARHMTCACPRRTASTHTGLPRGGGRHDRLGGQPACPSGPYSTD